MIKSRLPVFVSCLFVLSFLLAPSPSRTAKTQGATVGFVDADLGTTIQSYNICRSVKIPDSWEKLNETLFPSTPFVDYSAPRSETVFYRGNYVNGIGEDIPSGSVIGINTSGAVELAHSTLRFVDLESLAPIQPRSLLVDGYEIAPAVGVDGVVELDLSAGEHAIEVLADGYRPMRARHGAVFPYSVINVFNLVPEQELSAQLLERTANESYRLSGWVRAQESLRTIQDAHVFFESPAFTTEAITGPTGEFAFTVPADAFQNEWQIRAEARNRQSSQLASRGQADLPSNIRHAFLLARESDAPDASDKARFRPTVRLPSEPMSSLTLLLQTPPTTIRVGLGAPRSSAIACSGFNEKCSSSFNACSPTNIDVVDIETYVMRVFRGELFGTVIWNEPELECFKANAVAIRSYASFHALSSKRGDQYDICNSDSCQCYFSNFSAFGPISTGASQQTAGQVLLTQNDQIPKAEYGNWNGSCARGIMHCDPEVGYPNVHPIYDYALDANWNLRPPGRQGHGRGMSQYGSHFRAMNGETYQQILTFYYQDYGWRLSTQPVQPTPTLTPNVSATNVQVNQPFTVSTTLLVTNGTADHAGISISFPSLTSSGITGTPPNEGYNSAQGTVTTSSSSSSITGGSTRQYWGAGETLPNCNPNPCPAQHLLVEGDWVTVGAGNTKSLNLTVTPKVAGTFKVRIRGWVTAPAYQNPSRDPSSGSLADQQSFPVYEFTVTVSSCTYSISPPSASFSSNGGPGSFSVTTQTGCGWSASSDVSWITTSSSSTGSGTVNYSVAQNSSTSSRTGHVTVQGQVHTVTQSGTTCSYSVSPPSASFNSSGGPGSFSVTTQTGCGWSASSDVSWITTSSSSTGSGIVNYSVAQNSSTSSRTAHVTVQGQVHTVTQSGTTCSYSVSPPSASFNSSGGPGSFSVTTQTGCGWSASSDVSWITTSSSSTGSGTVNYSVAQNSSSSSRIGHVTVQGQTHTVTQSGFNCIYSISPPSASFTSAGGPGSFSVATQTGCGWSASSDVVWITTSSSTGSGTVNYSVASNSSTSSRTGHVTVQGQIHTVSQSGSVGETLLLSETFSGGIPPTWGVIDGGSGGGAAASWTTANPGGRFMDTPFSGAFAIADSDNAGVNAIQDEQLITPVINATGCDQVILEFSNQFVWYDQGLNEIADVDVSTNGGATWVNVLRIQGANDGFPSPNTKSIDITAAIGANRSNVRIRFHYYNANWEFWWAIDNIRVKCSQVDTDTIGLYNPAGSAFFLRNSNSGGIADITFTYGPAVMGFLPLVGDWDGDGTDTIGLYDPAHAAFFLRNSNSGGIGDITFTYGPAGLGFVPIVGDWDGNGIDTIGLYNPAGGAFFLRNSNSPGIADITFTYGPAGLGFIPVVGDWDGNGTDTIGLYNPAGAGFFLRNSNTGGIADITFTYGPAGAGFKPLVGDWNGDGVVSIGLYSPAGAAFFLRNSNSPGIADVAFTYGPAGSGFTPIAGGWDGL